MAIQKINLGTAPSGAGGDTFRSGSAKLQANDNELYNWIGNGSSVTTLPESLPVAKGGTGATTVAAARTALGLGSAATLNAGKNWGEVLRIGFGTGIGSDAESTAITGTKTFTEFFQELNQKGSGIYATSDGLSGEAALGTQDIPRVLYCPTLYAKSGTLQMAFWGNYTDGRVGFAVRQGSTSSTSRLRIGHLKTSLNTTVDGNGFIKNASPIVKLFADKIELNNEAQQQNIEFEKLGVGDYLIKGSTGFAQDGWYVETPKDANGNLLVAVVYEQLENGDISVKTYDYMLNNKGRIVADTETPLDITTSRWIDIRLQELPQPEVEVTDDPEQ